MAQARENDKMFSLRSRKGFGIPHFFRPDRLQHPLVHRGARGVGTSGARHVHYLGLVQTSQGLQEVAEVAADAVEVLKWSNGKV